MPDPLMYQQDNFVVLETNQPEQFLTASELLEKLTKTLEKLKLQDLPPDVQKFAAVETQAQYLLDTSCELDIGSGEYFQWYAVRLEK
ncbi:chlororespiratory reduction protein 7 [Cylindrospermum sp. FACHB-282]|uniref:chlororespiratory reduction protein 7 n=1 Tax=Cylindrospermum sp. FACHB-282 TaxID=2692794 RepID=UPI001684D428|nr:chlororespiratory reduction protein 7 [Cylindrospermum sp. FACHB-282]MBD2388454.1 chlororespiratory reduction protein 7 [Cylindrospermum sp. FACHB-282]